MGSTKTKLVASFGPDWRLMSDPEQYMLQHRQGKTWKTDGYYTQVNRAFKAFVEKYPRMTETPFPKAWFEALNLVNKELGRIEQVLTVKL